MDLNDPRRRLQVLTNSNPSLRIATAPQQKVTLAQAQPKAISIAQPKQYNVAIPQVQNTPVPAVAPNQFKGISVGQGENKKLFGLDVGQFMGKFGQTRTVNAAKDIEKDPTQFLKDFDNTNNEARRVYVSDLQKRATTDAVAGKTLKFLQDQGRFNGGSVGDFFQGANDRFLGQANAGVLHAADFVLPGNNSLGLGNTADSIDTVKNGHLQFNQSGKAGQVVGEIEKVAADLGLMATGSGFVNGVATKLPGVAGALETLAAGGKGAQLAAKVLAEVPGSLAGTGIDILQNAGKDQDIAKSAAIGTAVDLGIPVFGSLIKKGMNVFKAIGGSSGVSKSAGFVQDLINETNPMSIQKALNVDEVTANYLASETNPQAVEGILRQLEVDPSIQLSPEIRKRLQEEGISKVSQKDTPYGAEYNNGEISLKDQSFATPENIDHELGHHIFRNKLTPEEKALFNGEGEASISAKGRKDYTPEDVNSEDFSDYLSKAMSGRISEVPAKYQDVIAKYAKVAKADDAAKVVEDSGSVLHLPSHGVHAKVTPEQLAFLKDENKNIPWSTDDRPHLSAGDKVRNSTKEVTLEELGELSPNAKTALGNAAKQVPVQSADDVAEGIEKTQTGVTDGNLINDAKQAFPDADPDTQKAIQEVMDQLNPADRALNKLAKTRTQEKASRIGAGKAAFNSAGGGEAGVRAKLGALKGKYSESSFNPITASESTQTTLLNDIEKSGLRDFEKLNLQNAMRKVWGSAEGKPTKGDINSIRKYFGENGEDMAKAIEDAMEGDPKTWRDRIVDIAGVPRAAMASFDMSMGLRQGGQVAVRNFPQWFDANKESVKYVANTEYFQKEMKKIADDDVYELLTDKLGVRLPAVDGNSDEIMASAHILEKIPVYGKGIEASDRAYSGGLTKLRFNVAKSWIDELGGIDEFTKKFSDKEMKDIGEVINTSTGSGGKPGGLTERNMQTLATTLFAPRLWASRLNALNPIYYVRLSPVARKRALSNISSFATVASGVVALAHAAGAEVELDPRSSDFMKPKIGNTRYDVFGGLQQNVVFFARMWTGQKKNSSTGEIQTVGEGFGQPSRFDLAVDMGTNKLNPLLGYAVRLLKSSEGDDPSDPNMRKDAFGEDINIAKETGKLVVPLGVMGLADTIDDTGDIGKSAAMNIPSFIGIGTQTYGDVKTKDGGKDETGKLVFKGKVTEDMVLNDSGQPFLDEKGRPVKVKFDDGATALEKKALIDDKRVSLLSSEFKNNLSGEDKALMKLSDEQLQKYVKDKTIDQAKYDSIQRLQKGADEWGKDIKVPENVKSQASKTFYQKYNSMTEKDQKYWLKEPADDNAKYLATELNKTRSEGLGEFKPSNELSKAYAEYENDIESHPEYTEIDKRNKAKAFQTHTYKLNYTENQRDMLSEGGSNDLRTLIENKQIDKADLDEAMKADAELFNSGLAGSLKFSKKFRNDFGYTVPDGKGGIASDGGSGSKTKNAHLAALLPSSSTGKSSPIPQFSAKRRTGGISFKDVSTPKKSNSRKITINL